MIKLTRIRWTASVLLLLLMSTNFVAEGMSLYLAHKALLFPESKAAVCTMATSAPAAPDAAQSKSCCSQKKKKAAGCGCPHCGDNCPMGDACACDHDGTNKSRGTGLFFKAPGCHTEQGTHDGSYLPLSMHLVFVREPELRLTANLDPLGILPGTTADIAGEIPSPPVPPPRFMAA